MAEIAEHKYEIARHRRLLRKAAAALATIRGTGADPDLDHFLS